MQRVATAVTVLALCGSLATCNAPTAPSPLSVLLDPQENKGVRTPAQLKISSRLLEALELYREQAPGFETALARLGVKVDADGTTLVDIRADVTKPLLVKIQALGGTVISSFPQYQAIRARIPLIQIEPLAEAPDVQFVTPPEEAITNASVSTTG